MPGGAYNPSPVVPGSRPGHTVKVKVKKKKAPIPVPSIEATWKQPTPKPTPTPTQGNPGQKPKPTTPTMMDKKPPKDTTHGGHKPLKYEYVTPGDLALGVGNTSLQHQQDVLRYNQERERDRRKAAQAAEAERRQRRAAVRALDPKARRFIGPDRLQAYIQTGRPLDDPSIASALLGGAAHAVAHYAESRGGSPGKAVGDIFSVGDWWINKAPDIVFGKDTKGGGHTAGAVDAWDKMSTQEQIDTVVGGKSLSNTLQGQSLTPGNIARAIALAAMIPIPWGKGLPSLASALLRAGYSAEEARTMLRTGEGLREALDALKQPVRPLARAREALAPKPSSLLRPLHPDDAAAIASWEPNAARVGHEVLAHAADDTPIPTAALHGPDGLRAVAAYVVQGDTLIIDKLAGAGKGGGRAMMKELAKVAADKHLGIALTSQDVASHAFYTKIGMTPEGKRGFVWTPEQAAAFAEDPPSQLFATPAESPIPEVFSFTRAEAEQLPTIPGVWYHGTTAANAAEIEATGVLKVGERSDPRGAWLTANPVHAAQFGDTIIMVPESMIPPEAERISAFGGMIASPVDIPLTHAALPDLGAITPLSRSIADAIHASGLLLPPELDTPEQLARAIEDVFGLAKEGEAGKDWYKIAAAQVMRVAEHTGRSPKQIAQLFAIFSQAADTVANATFVFDASRQFEKFDDLFSGRFPVAQSKEALAVLQGGTWEGRKRSSFYANILRHIPGMEEEYAQVIKAMAEARGAPIKHPVTVDRWVVRMFRPGVKKDVPEKFYDTFETIMQHMAQELGWEPEQVQAAAWVAMKTRGLKAEIAKGGRQTVRHAAGGGDAFTHGVDRQMELEAQGALFKGLETTPQARRLANAVNKKWGGFTVNRDLTPVPETGYSVTYSLTEETYPLHKVKAADIEQFKERYKKLLRDSRNKIGGFSDDLNDTGDGTELSYLSVTRHFPKDSPQSKTAALRFARQQGQETVYEYKTGDGIRTGLSREEQRDIITKLDPASTKGGPVMPPPPSSAEVQYRQLLDSIVRGSGKGKRGVTQAQRDAAETETLKYLNRYPNDPELAEFGRLYNEVNLAGASDEPGWMRDESGNLSLGGFREPVPTRNLQLSDKTQQLPTARSQITRTLIERPADWASAQLMSEESKAAAMIRKVLPTASAEARVAKAAGRQQIIEASRAQAKVSILEHALPASGSDADIAHFYWAQLPASHRNAEGLRLIRNQQAYEVQEITSGRALTNIQEQMAAVKAQLSDTKDIALLGELEDLKILASDIPVRLEDLSVSLAKLDKVIASPPKLEPKVIESVRKISEERKRILIEAGMLDPERATNREGLLARWVGLEPTGEEAFIGHRLGKTRGAQSSLMPVSPGVGRPRVPQGVKSKNKLVLARTGRMRASTHVAVEDWRAAQTYKSALASRDDLAQMGTPFEGRLPEGHMLVNPKGRAIPPQWTTDHLSKIEEMDDEEIRKAAQEIMDGFLADASGADDMIAAAKEAGVHWDELRVVPENVVKRYYGQFTPAAGSGRAGKAYDAAVDFTAASIIFARIGYIPKNIVQNLIMAVPHQGAFLLVNIPRAAEALLDPQLRHLLHAEVGFSGATHGIGEELRFGQKARGLPSHTANLVGKVADDPARFSAFIHEAAAAGVIPKYSPHLSDADRAALLSLFTDESQRPLLNDIRSRSVEAMADFSRLTPTQRRWARRFLIIPGWLWAGSRYPFHFAATHPGRSAAIAYAAAGEPYADQLGLPQNPPITDAFAHGLPQFVEGIKIPDSFPLVGGKVFRTTSISPVSTPYEIALALGGQSPDTAASYANPLAKALWNIANRRVEYPGGSYQVGYQEAIIRNLERLLPDWTFVKQEIHPDGSGTYPEDATRLGRFFRELGVVPVKIQGTVAKDEADWAKEAERLSGEPVPPAVLELRKADRAYSATRSQYEKDNGIDTGLTPQETLSVLVLTFGKLHPERADEMKQKAEQALTLTDDEAEHAITEGREKMGLTAYGRIQAKLSKARLDARTHTGMVNKGQH